MYGSQRPPEALCSFTAFLVNWLGMRLRERFAAALAEHDLRPREFGLMNVIAATPAVTQQALGQAAGIDPSTMVATLDALQARGLAERHAHPSDRRKRVVDLTPAGEALLATTRVTARDLGEQLLAPLAPAERREFQRLLRKLAGIPEEPD